MNRRFVFGLIVIYLILGVIWYEANRQANVRFKAAFPSRLTAIPLWLYWQVKGSLQ